MLPAHRPARLPRLLRLLPLLAAPTLGGCGGGGGDPAPLRSLALPATGPLEGYVLADSAGTTLNGRIVVGDTHVGTQPWGVRGFVSFDLSALPPTADVLEATVQLHQTAVIGAPFGSLGVVALDHVVYGSVLEAGAYARSGLGAPVGVLTAELGLGPRRLDVTAEVRADLEARRGRAQFRLRFNVEHSGDALVDQVQFASVEQSASPDEVPTLFLAYRP